MVILQFRSESNKLLLRGIRQKVPLMVEKYAVYVRAINCERLKVDWVVEAAVGD